MLPHFRRILQSADIFSDVFKTQKIPKKKVVIDFSSPNMAKTFHVGNLRSTLYGNFIQKIYRSAGHDVYSINYLGDWGLQFVTLALYWKIMDRKGIQEFTLKEWKNYKTKQKIEFLTKCYFEANRYIKSNDELIGNARNLLSEMEHVRNNDLRYSLNENNIELNKTFELWNEWRLISIDYLREFYNNFDITHNEWAYESEQIKNAHFLTQKLIDKNVAFLTTDNFWAIHNRYINGKIILKKSDNSSLYLTRDLGAFFERNNRLNADEYLYVVDQTQYIHFTHLKSLVYELENSELAEKIIHVKYGRVIGLSTRLGKNDSVDFLINEGKVEAKRFINDSPTKRLNEPEEINISCEKLSRIAIIFDIMKRHFATNYTFSFKGAFKIENNNALLLSEKYSRLCSMEKVNFELMTKVNELIKNDFALIESTTFDLNGPALNLVRILNEFDTVVFNIYDQLEPCYLTWYLIKLSVQIGKSMAVLRVRGEIEKVALPRLMLFMASKRVLGDGMRMLGIEPLKKL